ncbi:superoxide dismutase family protein [Mycobacterium crocinum]|uniref:Superoxide dismutase family protein n=1 Tax=Mycolicibacterium crocinum TaxID=388459 RepID=A0ABY3TML6_9MYCO|nr:superoxide dismutase family protein [Mycolicibacterium crocinum]MCV7214448.1 superoxide dismutase family protein [Mycolicibacterium crocinum]ULN42705.1 superoxide dismutase family protein [Mycolicibacterium crocinum]
MLNRATAAAALIAAPALVLAGCNSAQNGSQQTTTTTSSGSSAQTIKAELKSPDGKPVANATIDFSGGFATVTVETVSGGSLSPGSHGMHIHSVGKCEADSVAPSGGAPGNFLSAGGHLQVGGRTEHPASGDLTPLFVRSDGSGKVVATTDAFKLDDLKGPEGSALIIHADADNFANIPQRYTAGGVPGPDAETLATGDAGARVACAVLAPASASTTTSVTTSTSTVTETTATVVPAETSPTTTSSASPTTTTTVSPTTTVTTSTTVSTTTSPVTPRPGG